MNSKQALLLYIIITIVWGANWTVTKLLILSVPPIWCTAIRSLIAALALLGLQIITRQFVVPKKDDMPAILVICLFHMVLFGSLMAIGLQYTSVGRSVILGYTTPLWVTPAAIFMLHEPVNRLRLLGVLLGIIGVIVLFDPFSEHSNSKNYFFGNALLMIASLSWALTIIFIKIHKWNSTPFQLVFWQNLLAFFLLAGLALFFEGFIKVIIDINLILQFAYSGLFATAFGFWAMTVVNKHLPATVTSLGMLATPIVGIACSKIILEEEIDTQLLIAGVFIFSGIILGCVNLKKQ